MTETEDKRFLYSNFQVTVGESTVGFSEVSGLCIEYEAVGYYRDGLSFVSGPALIIGKMKPVNLVLKKGLTEMKDYYHLEQWINKCGEDPFDKLARRDVTIMGFNKKKENGVLKLNEQISWKALAAMPVKLSVSSFDALKNEVVIASFELLVAKLIVTYEPKPQ